MGKHAVFKFGASDDRQQSLRGNNLVMWSAVEHLAHKGFEKLHLGRTSCEHHGLRRFKLSWGAAEELTAYYRYDMRLNDWTATRDRVFGFHNRIFARLPLPVNRLLGAILYPHLD